MAWSMGLLGAANAVLFVSDFDLIQTYELSGSQNTINFSSLNVNAADYEHLQIHIVARSDDTGSANARDLRLQINGDSSASYSWHTMASDGTGPYPSALASQTMINGPANYPRPNNGTYQYGMTLIDVLDFASTSKNTTIRYIGGCRPVSGEDMVFFGGGAWYNTAAVTSIQLFPNVGNWAAGSRFSIYGLRSVTTG